MQNGPSRVTRIESRTDLREFDGRLRMLVLLFVLPALMLGWRLYDLQVVRGEDFYRVAHENFVRLIDLAPDRGRIFDSRGRVLAENRPCYDVYATPRIFGASDDRIAQLRDLLRIPPEQLERVRARLEAAGGADVLVSSDVTRDEVAALETNRSSLPGVYIQVSSHRHYPWDALGAHVVGYMSEVTAEEFDGLQAFGYRPGEYVGRTGVERAMEPVLRGAPGIERQAIRVNGEPQDEATSRALLGQYRRVEAIPGKEVHLTINMDLQEIVDQAASNAVSAGIAVIDPRDGSVLSMFSKPGFNPNAWSGRLSEQEQRLSDNNPFHPMLDKSVQSWFPGSTFKVITGIAALEEGLADHDDTIMCPGYFEYGDRRFHCWNRGGHGAVNLRQALTESCDVYFYQLGLQLGIDRIAAYAYEFGFGERPGVGINGESAGNVPTREWHEQNSPGGFQYGFTVNTAVGQGDTRVSPLQLALAYGAIANGGTLYYPRLVDRTTNWDGRVAYEYPRRVRRTLPFASENLAVITGGLFDVVNSEDGTAFEQRLDYVSVAGKTGTAQVRSLESVRLEDGEVVFRDRDHAWFVAYAPVENPLIVVAVFLEHGGQGSSAAAPVAMRIIDRYFRDVLGFDDAIELYQATGDRAPLDALFAAANDVPTAMPAGDPLPWLDDMGRQYAESAEGQTWLAP